MNLLDRFTNRLSFRDYDDFYANFRLIVPENFHFAYDVVDEYAAIAPEKRAELALAEIRKVERGASLEIISQTDETIGGAPAVVITAKTKDKTPALIFQAALFHGQRVTMLVGIARGETDANLAYFQKLASTYAESPAAKNSAPAELAKRAAAPGGRA